MSGGVEPCQGLAGSWVLTKQTVVLPTVEEHLFREMLPTD